MRSITIFGKKKNKKNRGMAKIHLNLQLQMKVLLACTKAKYSTFDILLESFSL